MNFAEYEQLISLVVTKMTNFSQLEMVPTREHGNDQNRKFELSKYYLQ